ncbi:hypothetical protein SAMN03159353_10591 [Cedecea sp. NFIX57]|nr:hypothetical protein SAMN03159353_10591 [Cedecea sp. NFIX57]
MEHSVMKRGSVTYKVPFRYPVFRGVKTEGGGQMPVYTPGCDITRAASTSEGSQGSGTAGQH